MITLSKLSWLDYRFQVIGKIKNDESKAIIDKIEKMAGTKAWHLNEAPLLPVRIENCYIIDPNPVVFP